MFVYIYSLIAFSLICFYTVVMGTISLLFSIYDPTGKRQHACSRIWCKLISLTVGLKMTIHGLENLDLSGPVVYVSNHQSYMDIPALFAYLPFQFRVFAKKILFYIPFLGWHLWRAGHISVDRGNHKSTVHTLNLALRKLESGISVVVFPEGTRSHDTNKVKKLKAGGFKLAQIANVPIVPITLVGTSKILPRNSWLVYPGQVHMYIDPPIKIDKNKDTEQTISVLIDKVSLLMNAHLGRVKEKCLHD